MDVVINCAWQSQIRSLSQTCFELEANLTMLSRRLLIIKNNCTQFSTAFSYNGSRFSLWEPFINLNLLYSTSPSSFPHPVCEGSPVIINSVVAYEQNRPLLWTIEHCNFTHRDQSRSQDFFLGSRSKGRPPGNEVASVICPAVVTCSGSWIISSTPLYSLPRFVNTLANASK